MGKINDSQSVSSLRDRRTGLEPDPSATESSTVSGRTSQLEFDSSTNRVIPSPEAIQANSGKDNKQPVRRIRKKWIQEENRKAMEQAKKLMGMGNGCMPHGETRVCLI